MVTVVLFTTSNCGYCGPIKTMIEHLKSTYEDDGRVEFTTLTLDKDTTAMNIAREWGIQGVPSILIIADQEEKQRLVGGEITAESLVDAIEGNLQRDVLSE